MARSTADIYEEIKAAWLADEVLGTIDGTSITLILSAWAWIVAAVVHTLEVLFDSHKEETELTVKNKQVHKEDWYADQLDVFQYGDVIQCAAPDYVPFYEEIDESKRIIKYRSVKERDSQLVIKVAKEGPAALSNVEKDAALAYINSFKDAGVEVNFISKEADVVWFNVAIHYNPQLDLDELKASVEAATVAYLETGIDFNGLFKINQFIDKLQAISEDIDPVVNFIKMKKDGSSTYTTVSRVYEAESGHFKVDPDHPIDDVAQFQYIALT